jgi:HTH-type transcriptional regulator / antitoxin HigA
MGKLRTPPKGCERDSYLELVCRFPLRPLRADADLDRAVEVIDGLLDRRKLDDGEQDYLDVLSDLVEKYEDEHVPIPPASDGDIIRFLLELRALSQADLARQAGIAESTISAVLSGKRQLSRRHIGILATFFKVEPAVFSFSD